MLARKASDQNGQNRSCMEKDGPTADQLRKPALASAEEKSQSVIDLTFALDKFLGTDGSAKVQFRIVV